MPFILLICVYFSFSNLGFLYAVAAFLTAFVFLVAKHSSLYEKKIHIENLVKINELESASLSGNYNGLDPGTGFVIHTTHIRMTLTSSERARFSRPSAVVILFMARPIWLSA